MERDWANLGALPLSLVLDKLEEHIDHVWFGAVCKSWRSVAKLNHQDHQFKTNILPMLLLSTETKDMIEKNWLYGIPNKRRYPLQFPLYLANSKFQVCGSSHGWLALLDYSKSIITLMNPFKDIPPIILPPINWVYKVTLSADPIISPNDYVVVAIYDIYGNLAFIRRGQKNWTNIDTSNSYLIDVIFYKGLLFALNIRNKIVSFNCYFNDPLGKKTITSNVVLEEKVDECFVRYKFLVESLKEELWMVKRCSLRKSIFHVYKLKLDAKSEKLEQMLKLKSLEDNILFLGAGDSISMSASYFSKSLQRDSIYFANGLKIYNVKSESSYDLCPGEKSSFWVLPHFQWD